MEILIFLLQILPVENRMKDPKNFLSVCGVLNFSVLLSCICNIFVGLFSCIQYGDDIAESVTLNVTGWYGTSFIYTS